mgnify:CR=1 FL=1
MLMLWEFVISCDNLINVVISTQRDNKFFFAKELQERRYQEKPIFQGLQKLWNAVRCAGIYIECNTYAAGMQQRY